jgi:hypothetical protein
MKILFDINHPAHSHFFKNPAVFLAAKGHKILFTSRLKECATDLLDSFGFSHQVLSVSNSGNPVGMVKELLFRDFKLLRYVRNHRPDIMCAIGGPFIAQVSMLTRIPSLVFYDTENAHLQNLIAYPFAHKVIVPRCYQGKTPRNTIRYPGYHELSYLHPNHFKPDRSIAVKNGLNPDVPNFLIRMVAWNANHDLMECGWNANLLEAVLEKLQKTGNVCISSEGDIPNRFKKFLYKGNLSEIHHFMAFCDLYVGESATMASECAVLGVPAIYVAKTGRGYISDQENRYGLVKHIQTFSLETVFHTIDHFLAMDADILEKMKSCLIRDNVDVAQFVSDLIERRQKTV